MKKLTLLLSVPVLVAIGCAAPAPGADEEGETTRSVTQAVVDPQTRSCPSDTVVWKSKLGRRRASAVFNYLRGASAATTKAQGGFGETIWNQIKPKADVVRNKLKNGTWFLKNAKPAQLKCGQHGGLDTQGRMISVNHELWVTGTNTDAAITALNDLVSAVDNAFDGDDPDGGTRVARFLVNRGGASSTVEGMGVMSLAGLQTAAVVAARHPADGTSTGLFLDPEVTYLSADLGSTSGASASFASATTPSNYEETAYRWPSDGLAGGATVRGQSASSLIGSPCATEYDGFLESGSQVLGRLVDYGMIYCE